MNYANLKRGIFMAAPALALALMPALAQPPSKPAPADKPSQPGAGQPGGDRPQRGDRPGRGGQPQSEWAEKYREQARDHPRLARSLINLHDTKDYLQKAPHDFGGHKAAAMKQIDGAIAELEAAMKAEPKVERPPAPANGDQRRRQRPQGDQPPPKDN